MIRRLIMLSLVLGGLATAAHGGDAFTVRPPDPQADPRNPVIRQQAAAEALRRLSGSSEPFTALAVASRPGLLSLERAADGSIVVSVPSDDAVRRAASVLTEMARRYGPPRVVLRPANRKHASDRDATPRVVAALREAGFDAIEEEAALAVARDAADRAVKEGADPEQARRLLEARGDFLVLVQGREASNEETTYGREGMRCTATVQFLVRRPGYPRPVKVPGGSAIHRTYDQEDRARKAAMEQASDAGSQALATALSAQWLGLGDGTGERVVEIDGAPPPSGEVEVLEGQPIWSVVRLVPDDPRRPSDFGRVLLERPGYALVRAEASWSGWRLWAALLPAPLLAAAAALAWRRRSRPTA